MLRTKIATSRSDVTVRSLLVSAFQNLRSAGWQGIFYAFVWNLAIAVVASPIIGWLFRRALNTDGMVAIDMATTRITDRTALSFLLLIVLAVVAFAFLLMQTTTVFEVIYEDWQGHKAPFSTVVDRLTKVFKKLLRPSSIPIFVFVFLLLPVGGMGFLSVMTQGIAVPNFVSGELLKDPTTAIAWHTLMAVIFFLNLRLAPSIPLFVLSDSSGWQSMRQSWHLTGRFNWLRLLIAAIVITVPILLLASLLHLAFVLPTLLIDHIAPAASPYVAAFSIGAAQILSLVLLSVLTVLLASLLVHLVEMAHGVFSASRSSRVPEWLKRFPASEIHWGWVTTVVAVIAALPLSFAYVTAMEKVVTYPESTVIAHRGYVGGGVENTIGALEAAVDIDAEAVEMDVMQTKDGKFVVIHDHNLKRLAGMNKEVKDLTQEELVEITVRDGKGHEDQIPTLEEYVLRAKELGMPLLIEVKMGGLDTPDHVDLLVDELDRLDALDGNMFHSLDPASVTRLKELVPDATVGYIMPFSGEGLPQTMADFLVLEEYTASVKMHERTQDADLGYVVWTVDETDAQKLRFRQGVDAIITDKPIEALESRENMRTQTGLAPALLDLLQNMLPL